MRAAAASAGFLIPRGVPPAADRRAVERLTGAYLRARRGKVSALARDFALVLGGDPAGRWPDAAHYYGTIIECGWARLRAVRAGAWRPDAVVEGLEHIERAGADGHGVLLWRTTFSSTLVAKAALARSGVDVVHLSQQQHGAWSDSPALGRPIAALYRRGEDAFLSERVIIPRGGSLGFMKTLVRRLQSGAVVSIVGEYTGRRNVVLPFLDRQAAFANGAPSLSWKTGARLLPVFALREGPMAYRVVVEAPVDPPRELPRDRFVLEAVRRFADRLETRVRRHPGSWTRWRPFLERTDAFSHRHGAPSLEPAGGGPVP